MAREQLKTLTEPMYYVLLSLIKENHGYGIMQMISELTEGRVAVGAGTLYALLGRFEKEEIIFQVAEENRRKIYKLTEKGQNILQEELQRLNKMVSDGQKFFEYDGERPAPPDDNTGSGISMPITEEVCNKEQQIFKEREKGFTLGGFGKGALIPT
ncbi:PadR family transcriptional regulator [Aminipila sp.]|uniref:PadR family transcriptional regulator n=1 Tax=Aminipila sp. TaxID=2060095 RepID=UPI00289F36ED|nr:PadR family transcriptional regulator [Aminipila sp.]